MGSAQSTCGVTTEGRRLLKAVEDGSLSAVDVHLKGNVGYVYWSTFSGGNTVWHKAAKAGHLGLLKSMANIVTAAYETSKGTEEGHHHTQVLHKVGANPKDAIKRLVNMFNFKRCTPLMLAAARGHAEAVEWLLGQGAMLLVHDRVRHNTALHYAVEGGNPECVRLLLSAAAHTAPATEGTQQRGPTERQLLLAAGNHAGLTALHYAVHEDKFDAIKLLLSYGADINAQAEYPDLDWANVNAGDTPMHVAAAKGSIEAIRILLKGFVEHSGLLCPDFAPPRHIRDPRGVRNDYGRLPYHLAMRKQFAWLAELLDPSVPVRYLLTGEEPDTATSFGPPRLAAITAKVLHDKLMSELRALKEAARAAALATGEGAPAERPSVANAPNSLEIAQAAERAAAAARVPRRRWTWNGGRGVSGGDSGAAGGGAAGAGGLATANGLANARGVLERLLTMPGGQDRAVAASAVTQSAGGALQSPEWRGAGGSGGGRSPGGPRSRVMSPRVSVASIPEEELVIDGRQQHEQQQQGQGHVMVLSRRSSRSLAEGPDRSGPASPRASATAHVSVLPAAGLLDGKRKGSGNLEAEDSSGLIAAHVGGSSEVEVAGSSCSGGSGGCGSSSGGGGSPGGSGAEGSSGQVKVSPNPELLDEGHGPSVLDGLLRPFRRTTSHRVAPTSARCSHSLSDDGVTCGVCLDALPATCIMPCKHVMCVDCATDMCKRYSLGTAACPFCRSLVAGFKEATRDEMRQY